MAARGQPNNQLMSQAARRYYRYSLKALRKAALFATVLLILFLQPRYTDAFSSPKVSLSWSRRPCFRFNDRSWLPSQCYHFSPSSSTRAGTFLCARYWEGDDIRWGPKLRRRFARMKVLPPARTILVVLNIGFFFYQVLNSLSFVIRHHPAYWPGQAVQIVTDVLLGRSITGPFTADFAHSASLSRYQPHRYLSAGFLHGSLLHLAVNLDALVRIPMWVETGLGWPLYITAYLVAVVTGNMVHGDSTAFCLGASGGICGLYGLMFSALQKMGNTNESSKIIRGMIMLILYGVFLENVSNASHVGGFIGGLIIGYLCGPGYRKSYSMRRQWSLDVDEAPPSYRRAMGFGVVPTRRGFVPLQLVWAAALFAVATNPKLKSIPRLMFRGLLHPGSLSGLN